MAAGTPGQYREHESRRANQPPQIDGDLSDPAWQQAPATQSLIQTSPDPGKSASYETLIRILHDDQALYIGARCQDPEPQKIIARITRRDRWIESDWFRVDIDSRHDKRSGFFFNVNAAGVKQDGVLFDEYKNDIEWDGVWQAATKITDDGWQVEMRIPFHLLRFSVGDDVSFGINFLRYISRLNETGLWQYISPESGKWVSRFGSLSKLDLNRQPSRLEAAPYLASKISISSNDASQAETQPIEVGVDGKLSLDSNFMLTLTANPDFGQVEVDQVVLNLSTIETYYPEKRPFFLEDKTLFQVYHIGDGTPSAQLFYTRRIGRSPRLPSIGDNEEIVKNPQLTSIYGAAKLAGRTDGRFSIGLLQAVTSEEVARVQGADGIEYSKMAEPLTSFSVLRLRQGFWDHSALGLMATAVATPESGSAITGGTDLEMELFDQDYKLCLISQFSYLTKKRFEWHDDFTRAALDRDGPFGYGGEFNFHKVSGEHFVGAVGGSYRSPSLALNDIGYLSRQDVFSAWYWMQYRYIKPLGSLTKIQINTNGWLYRNTNMVNIGDGLNVNGWVSFRNNWNGGVYVEFSPANCDDRETRSQGRVLFCNARGRIYSSIWINSDQRKLLAASMIFGHNNTDHGHAIVAKLPIYVNPISNLQFELAPSYRWSDGIVRWLDTVEIASADRYLFGREHNQQWDITFRGTFTFTPEMTLQAYAQAFMATVDYGTKYEPGNFDGSRIELADLEIADDVVDDYDFTSANFNIGAVFRWEYLPGSLAYLVYTGAFGDSMESVEFRFNKVFQNLLAQTANHTVMLKLSYLWD
jgi:hypothetical protein